MPWRSAGPGSKAAGRDWVTLMRALIARFFAWYERNYALNVGIATLLFLLQIVHLHWLTTDVVVARLTGESWFSPSGPLRFFIVVIDYTEIPALLSVSLDLHQRAS